MIEMIWIVSEFDLIAHLGEFHDADENIYRAYNIEGIIIYVCKSKYQQCGPVLYLF